MRNLLLVLITLLTTGLYAQSNYNIEIELDNYEEDMVIIGNYHGAKTLVKDTLYRQSNGKWNLKGDDKLDAGVYLLLLQPSNKYAQFLVDGIDNEFSIKWDSTKADLPVFQGSEDNDLYNSYLRFLDSQRPEADKYRAKLQANKNDKAASDKLAAIDKRVKDKQQEIIKNNPNTITALFIKSTLSPNIPEYKGSEQDVQLKRYQYYKKHYFDNIDLGDPRMLRTPFLNDRVEYYIEKLTPQDPDSIIRSVDYLLGKMAPASETTRFYTSHILNKYANMKIVGMDAVYVHMIDNYYAKGKTPWVDEQNLYKLKDNADDLRNILIGKRFPDITTYLADGTPFVVNDVKSDYTIVLFWAFDCGHCTKSMPDIIKFYNEYKNKGVTLVSICSKPGKEDTQKCIDAIPEKGMGDFINTFDEFQRYRRKIHLKSTPKVFVLDKDKKIIIKDIPAKEMSNVMKQVMEMDAKKKM